jgi:uncharacterized protein YdaU (DUF1376 family)
MARKNREGRKLEFFAWYAGTYAAATTHLTREADYAYRRILDHIFIHEQESCRVADDDEMLMAISRCSAREWKAIRRALIDGPSPLLRKDGDWIYSDRLAEEIAKAKDKSRKRKQAADDMWAARGKQKDCKCNANASDLQCKCNESASNSNSSSLSAVDSGSPEQPKEKERKTELSAAALDAAEAYRLLSAQWKSPRLTDKKLASLSGRIQNVTRELEEECDGFNWADLMRRAWKQPFIREISSFDFEWFLKRESGGTRLNARKVWHEQFRPIRDFGRPPAGDPGASAEGRKVSAAAAFGERVLHVDPDTGKVSTVRQPAPTGTDGNLRGV